MSDLQGADIGLREGGLIVVRISAQNAAGWGMQSAANYSGAVIESGAPDLTALLVTKAGRDYQLQWNHPVSASGQAATFAGYTYDIEHDNGSNTGNFITVGQTPNNSYIVPGIRPEATVNFRVRAQNTCGAGDWAYAVGAGVDPPGQLQPPLVQLVDCDVIFTWGIVDNSGGADITYNQIAVADS